jgi:hypothetical protein
MCGCFMKLAKPNRTYNCSFSLYQALITKISMPIYLT